MVFEEEVFFTCPYCWQKISMVFEAHMGQTYIEDCEICCQPIQVEYSVSDGQVTGLTAKAMDES